MLLSGLQTRTGLPVFGSGAVDAPLETSQRLILRVIQVDLGNENLN